MNLTNEQIQAILDGAPNDGFNSSAVIMHSLYEEILALRQEVELLKALNNGLKAPTARCSTRFICIVCGKGGGSFLNIRPPQSYSCSHCESKNTMLPKHVHDAVKAQQSEVAARAVEDLKCEVHRAIGNMEYAAFNLCESMNLDSKCGGRIVETSCPKNSLLIAIRDLKEDTGTRP